MYVARNVTIKHVRGLCRFSILIFAMEQRGCRFVCVCVRERERENEGKSERRERERAAREAEAAREKLRAIITVYCRMLHQAKQLLITQSADGHPHFQTRFEI
jgi:hypothetical protein